MDKVAAAVLQEIMCQPQHVKLSNCLYRDIQTRTMEKLANLDMLEKIAYNENLYRGGYNPTDYTNIKGPSFSEQLKNTGNALLQSVKSIPSLVKGSVKDPKRMRNAFNLTMAGVSPISMENFAISNVVSPSSPIGNIAGMIGTSTDIAGFLGNMRKNYKHLGR